VRKVLTGAKSRWKCGILRRQVRRAQSRRACDRRLGMHYPRNAAQSLCSARNWPAIRETKRMYWKLAERADHPVVKNGMLALASSIGRICMPSALGTNVHNEKDDVVARAVRRPRRSNLWCSVIGWSRRLPNSGEFS
jgi:hypothetical protein